jgi:hypothetical protein
MGRVREALARAEHSAARAIAAMQWVGREAGAKAGALWQRSEAALRPHLHRSVALAGRGVAHATARAKPLGAALARLMATLAGGIGRGAAALAGRAEPWRAALERRIRALAGCAERGIAALARWRRR